MAVKTAVFEAVPFHKVILLFFQILRKTIHFLAHDKSVSPFDACVTVHH